MTLGEYVKQIMDEKNLKSPEVERRSGKKISDGYIDNIVKGTAKNVTVDKLKALAAGLETDEDALFRVARGLPPEPPENQWPPKTLLQSMVKIVDSPELTGIVKRLVHLKRTQLSELSAIMDKKFGRN